MNERPQNGSDKMEVSLKVDCLSYTDGKQLSIPLINLGRKCHMSYMVN